MYALMRKEDGKFVAMPGSKKMYTRTILAAQLFQTREQALGNACGNEVVCNVSDLFQSCEARKADYRG